MDQAYRKETAGKIRDYLSGGNHPLRAPQVLILDSIAKDLDSGYHYGWVRKPTGTGKTVAFGSMIAALGVPTLVLEPRTQLADQTQDTFVNVNGLHRKDIGRYYSQVGTSVSVKALNAPVLITTYQSYIAFKQRGMDLAEDRPLIILDEVHHTNGEVTRPLIQDLLKGHLVYGWTATDTDVTGNTVGDYLFGRERPIHRTTIVQSVDQGEIVPFKNIVVETHLHPDQKIYVSGNRDFTEEEMQLLIQIAGRDEVAFKTFYGYEDVGTGARLRDMNSIWYTAGIAHANHVAGRLNHLFGKDYAMAVNGQTRKRELSIIIDAHRRGEIPALVNADLLIEGFDSPPTEVAMMLRPTRSPVIAEQTGGRILRVDPENPSKVGYIVTLIDEGRWDVIPFGVVAGDMFRIPKKTSREYEPNLETLRRAAGRKTRMSQIYEALGSIREIDLSSSELELQNFTRRRTENRLRLVQRPQGYLNRREWSQRLNLNPVSLEPIWTFLTQAWINSIDTGESFIYDEDDKTVIKRDQMGIYKSGNTTHFCVATSAEAQLNNLIAGIESDVEADFEGDWKDVDLTFAGELVEI